MIHRIMEALTRPHDQVTAIDELIQMALVLGMLAVAGISLLILTCMMKNK
jgi:hypothetical protein